MPVDGSGPAGQDLAAGPEPHGPSELLYLHRPDCVQQGGLSGSPSTQLADGPGLWKKLTLS